MKSFEQKVRAMTAREIILAMVDGLENPVVKVDMGSYGRAKGMICFGCAATNTICKIWGKSFTPNNIEHRDKALRCSYDFIDSFETAINELRKGEIEMYNDLADDIGMAKIRRRGMQLPWLTASYTPADLIPYKLLAAAQGG